MLNDQSSPLGQKLNNELFLWTVLGRKEYFMVRKQQLLCKPNLLKRVSDFSCYSYLQGTESGIKNQEFRKYKTSLTLR